MSKGHKKKQQSCSCAQLGVLFSVFCLEECDIQNRVLCRGVEWECERAPERIKGKSRPVEQKWLVFLFHLAWSCLGGAGPRIGNIHKASRLHSSCQSHGGHGVWREHSVYSVMRQCQFWESHLSHQKIDLEAQGQELRVIDIAKLYWQVLCARLCLKCFRYINRFNPQTTYYHAQPLESVLCAWGYESRLCSETSCFGPDLRCDCEWWLLCAYIFSALKGVITAPPS